VKPDPRQAPAISISRRVSITLLAWALLWGVALALGGAWAVRHEMSEMQDDTLRSTAEALAGTLGAADLHAQAPKPAASAPLPEGDPDLRVVWQVLPLGSGVIPLRTSRGAPAGPLMPTPAAGFATVQGWRVYAEPLPQQAAWLLVAQSRGERAEAQREVATTVLVVTVVMALASLVWLRWRMRIELAPLEQLSRRLAGHDPLAAGATLGPAARRELAPVHAAIDALSQRLAARLAQEQAFSAHAAHALRTPLAGIDAQLAVALREAALPLQPRLQRVRAAAVRLQRVVAALLSLFRSGVDLQREPLELGQLVARMPVEGLQVQVEPGEPVQADADLLTAALLNLLDNAARHGARQVRISTPRAQCLRVQDDGPGVTPTQLQALRDALAQERPERPVGLGLVLAQLVARAHGGGMHLPGDCAGFVVELDLGPRPASAAVLPSNDDTRLP
jgi:signal transduction histidine kinase